MNSVLTRKLESLELCIKRIREVYARPGGPSFEDDLDKQEIIILNLIRAADILSDMANHIVREKKLGWPNDKAETYNLLERNGLITSAMTTNLIKANGMRNIMVHEYEDITLDSIKAVIEHHLDEMLDAGRTLFEL